MGTDDFLLQPFAAEETDLQGRERRRKESLARVDRLLQEQRETRETRRTLRRFGCSLIVALHYHRKGGRQRVEAVMPDNISWGPRFQEWLVAQLGIKESKAKDLMFQYFDKAGHSVRVEKQLHLQAWLDESWARHPPQLHAYDTASILEEAEEKAWQVAELFNEYCKPGGDTITFDDMREMLLRLDLLGERTGGSRRVSSEVERQDIVAFINEEVARADADKDGLVSRKEFDAYYNGLQDYLKTSLADENRYEYTLAKFRAHFVQARSYRRSLATWVDELDGLVLLDALGHDYQISLTLPRERAMGAEGARWVRAQTLLELGVDHFEDGTGRMGAICSSVVWVECEAGLELSDYTLQLPHGFDEEQELNQEDVLVVFSSLADARWQAVNPSRWELMPAVGGGCPSVRVTMAAQGVLCVASRSDVRAKLRMRVHAYMPAMVIPLESERVVVHVAPDLPEAAESIRQHEKQARGAVALVGASGVLAARPHTFVELALTTEQTESHGLAWRGEAQSVSFEVDPRFLMHKEMAASIRAGGADEDGETEVGVHLALHVTLTDPRRDSVGHGRAQKRASVVDLALRIHVFPSPSAPRDLRVVARTQHTLQLAWAPPESSAAAGGRRTSWHGRGAYTGHDPSSSRRGSLGSGRPSAPQASRRARPLGAQWRRREAAPTAPLLPASARRWGGCALMWYEVQVREKTLRGTCGEWQDGYMGDAGRCRGVIDRDIYACDLRIRAYNLASAQPSAWTELSVGSAKDEAAALEIQKVTRGKAARKSARAADGEGRGAPAASGRARGASGVRAEGGVATVEQGVLDTRVKQRKTERCMADDARWCAFSRTLGGFYLELGLRGGVEGALFELTPQACKELVRASHAQHTHLDVGLSLDQPLMSLAKVGSWVLQTLAHYAAEGTGDWIEEVHAIGGLVALAASVDVTIARRPPNRARRRDEGASPEVLGEQRRRNSIEGILRSLIDAYETLRQCEPGTGFVTLQLENRYDKPLRRAMQDEWAQELVRLRHNVACHVMNLLLGTREYVCHPQLHPKARGTGLLHLVSLSVTNVPAKRRNGLGLCLAFQLDGVDAPPQRTLCVPLTTQPVWEDGIVSLRLDGAAPPLSLHVELLETPLPSHAGAAGASGLGTSVLGSVSVELQAGHVQEVDGFFGLVQETLAGAGVAEFTVVNCLFTDGAAPAIHAAL